MDISSSVGNRLGASTERRMKWLAAMAEVKRIVAGGQVRMDMEPWVVVA